MTRFLLARLAFALLQLAAVAVVVFALTSVLPGDTAVVSLGERGSDDQIAALRERLGLDRSPGERFAAWVAGLARGDLGVSLLTGVPVAQEIAQAMIVTGLLTAFTLAIVLPLAATIGIVTGLSTGSRTDRALNSVVLMLNSIPEFALGVLLVGVLSLHAGWFPATAAGLSGWSLAAEPGVLVLPVVVLVSKHLCVLARQIRIGVAEADNAEYAKHARMHGLPEPTVLLKTVLPSALAPVAQQLARTVEGLLGGVVVVEALFALPGMGSGFVEAVMARDLPTVQGYALVFAATTVLVNLVGDLLAHRLSPQRGCFA